MATRGRGRGRRSRDFVRVGDEVHGHGGGAVAHAFDFLFEEGRALPSLGGRSAGIRKWVGRTRPSESDPVPLRVVPSESCRLQAIALVGKKAAKVKRELPARTDLPIFETYHRSPLFVNRRPGSRELLLEVFRENKDQIAQLVDRSVGSCCPRGSRRVDHGDVHALIEDVDGEQCAELSRLEPP